MTGTLPHSNSPKRTVLLNPGPVTLTESVRRSLLLRDMCHREEAFSQLMQSVRRELLNVYALSENEWTSVLLTGSGTAAVESMVTSLVNGPGKALVAANGVYGERIATMLERSGKSPCVVRSSWEQPIDLPAVEQDLKNHASIRHVIAVHHETTTGRLNDLDQLSDLCKRYDKRLLIDAVSSFGAEAIDFDAWPIDAVAATANKCLHGVPGAAFVITRRSEMDRAAESGASGLYLDLSTNYRAQETGFPAFTPAIPAIYALDQALLELKQSGGWCNRQKVYRERMQCVTESMHQLGIARLLDPNDQSCILTSFILPADVTYQSISEPLSSQGIVIYAGQKHLEEIIFRIAVMGDLRMDDLDQFNDTIAGVVNPGELSAGKSHNEPRL